MSNTFVPAAIARIAPDGNLTPRLARRFLIELSLRKQKPGTGSSLEFLRERTAMNAWPDLREVLNGIPWVITDGVATRAYMPERLTNDLDILVRHADGDEVVQRLGEMGYELLAKLAIPGYALRSADGVEIDVLLGDMAWLSNALQEPHYDPAGFPVLSLPYLVLMKLDAVRAQDWADVARMLGLATDEELDEVRRAVARYSPEDSDDLESLIYIGRQELRSPAGSQPAA